MLRSSPGYTKLVEEAGVSVSLKAPHSWSIENIDDEKLATSSEFDCRKTTSVIDVFKLELLVFFTFSVEIDPADSSLHLVEANVVEPFEASTGYRPHPVIGYEEVFLPPHEDVLALREILVGEVRSLRLLSQRTPRRESSPVVHIGLLRRSPCFMACLEGVLCPDYLALEEGCQCRMVFRQALYAEITTEIRLGHVNVFYLHIDVVDLTIGLLGANEFASSSKKGGSVVWK